uniref:Uncharacterized protein n=1 Tax=Schizaphis graminum TaxID=13262 RepID=A0A2S2PEX8_SCHGA
MAFARIELLYRYRSSVIFMLPHNVPGGRVWYWIIGLRVRDRDRLVMTTQLYAADCESDQCYILHLIAIAVSECKCICNRVQQMAVGCICSDDRISERKIGEPPHDWFLYECPICHFDSGVPPVKFE